MTRLLPLLAALALPLAAPAAETNDSKATNPFFDTNSLQLQPALTDVEAGGHTFQFLTRLVLAYDGIFLPGVKVGDMYTLARQEMYGATLVRPGKKNVSGLQDWNDLLLAVKPFEWGAQIAFGGYAVLPTATDSALGTREFQLGPAAGFLVSHVHNLEFGALFEIFWSVAGTTTDLETIQLQPIATYHLPAHFFLKTDPILVFDLEKSPTSTVPLNFHVGNAFNDHLSLSAIFEWVATGSGSGNGTGQLNLNYVGW